MSQQKQTTLDALHPVIIAVLDSPELTKKASNHLLSDLAIGNMDAFGNVPASPNSPEQIVMIYNQQARC